MNTKKNAERKNIMNPKNIHILSMIYIIISAIFCFFLNSYNTVLYNLREQHYYSDLQLISANNNAAINYFFGALILVITAFFLLFFLLKTFSLNDDTNAKNFFKTLALFIAIIIILIFIIKLISIPILQLILKITVVGSIIIGVLSSNNS